MNIYFSQSLLGALFLSIIFLHLAKKNFQAVVAYGIQSFVITVLLFNSFLETKNFLLFFVVVATLAIKVILAPIFFTKLIHRYKLTFLVTSYLNMPLTLIVLAAFTAIARSHTFLPLTSIVPAHQILLSLALSAIFISLFLVINRKDALSQAIGILSLENSIVTFAVFSGLEQSPMLQLGIVFDIFIWLVITTIFISKIYQYFGTLDTSIMKHLKD